MPDIKTYVKTWMVLQCLKDFIDVCGWRREIIKRHYFKNRMFTVFVEMLLVLKRISTCREPSIPVPNFSSINLMKPTSGYYDLLHYPPWLQPYLETNIAFLLTMKTHFFTGHLLPKSNHFCFNEMGGGSRNMVFCRGKKTCSKKTWKCCHR